MFSLPPVFHHLSIKISSFYEFFTGSGKKGKSEIHILWISRILPKKQKIIGFLRFSASFCIP